MKIIAFFSENGVPATGLTPHIDVWEIDGVPPHPVNNQVMTEIAGGSYYYDFAAYDGEADYAILADGGAVLEGPGRYVSSSNELTSADDVKASLELPGSKLSRIYDNEIIRSGVVSTVVSQYLEFNTDLSEAANNYWTRGALRWTSGDNEGTIRKIQIYSASTGYIKLRTEAVNPIQTSDTFDIISLRAFRINYEDVEQIIDTIFGKDTESGLTFEAVQRIVLASVAGKTENFGLPAADKLFKSVDGLTDRITATTDANGNRNSVNLDGS